jgi:hypothetical protein
MALLFVLRLDVAWFGRALLARMAWHGVAWRGVTRDGINARKPM